MPTDVIVEWLKPKDPVEISSYLIPPQIVDLNGSEYMVYVDDEGTSYAQIHSKLGSDSISKREKYELILSGTNSDVVENLTKRKYPPPYRPIKFD